MSMLVVGSVALDTVETPFGKVEEALGGSATYFSIAASLYGPVRVVGAVGEDFPAVHLDLLRRRGVDTSGLEVAPGRTFRWIGRYEHDLNVAHTIDTQLNVFATFHPKLPGGWADTEYVLLANIDPELQLEVLHQVRGARLKMLDTMNYWIASKRAELTATMREVDVVLMNEGEARQYADTYNLRRAARDILALGPKALVVKRGEYGAVLFTEANAFIAPAYPLEEVKDPTGAGDCFAGGFLGHLARTGEVTPTEMRRAVIHGSVVASFVVEDFSVNRLVTVSRREIEDRYREFVNFTRFEDIGALAAPRR